jgi:hypothetical protein
MVISQWSAIQLDFGLRIARYRHISQLLYIKALTGLQFKAALDRNA